MIEIISDNMSSLFAKYPDGVNVVLISILFAVFVFWVFIRGRRLRGENRKKLLEDTGSVILRNNVCYSAEEIEEERAKIYNEVFDIVYFGIDCDHSSTVSSKITDKIIESKVIEVKLK